MTTITASARTRSVGGYEFIVSTDPEGEGGEAGDTNGTTRSAMEFTVKVKAEATGNFVGPPPLQMTFEFSRPATGGTNTRVGDLVSLLPPSYEFLWPVRQDKGRWQIKLLGYRSNTVSFKIDKRKQIVEVANSWVGAAQYPFDETPAQAQGYHGGTNCDDLARYVYGHVGLVAGGGATVTDLFNSMSPNPDSQSASIWFYRDATTGAYQHNGINVGGNQTVDQNCGHPHSLGQLPTVNTHAADDTNLVNPQKYSAPISLSPNELQQLDTE